ncbi:hypothetical protein AN642_01730 [Epulopiscium sp. SCG-B10WGA-EpuloA2]|nr:hypothetical protein AN642_01730 [Epulopiscium sp. SCG-B10WGA-EpuloA2]
MRFRKRKIPVFIISGNHDNARRLSFGNDILKVANLYIITDLSKKIEIKKYGQVYHFYLIPYKSPTEIRHHTNDLSIKNHQKAMEYTLSQINKKLDITANNILICHCFVGRASNKEVSIGNIELIDYNIFKNFDYVALGHLHKQHCVGRNEVCYSGSILKYGFSEVNHNKSINKITIRNKNVKVEHLMLSPIRDFKIMKDTLENILKFGREYFFEKGFYLQDYIHAVLLDEGDLINPIGQLRNVFPNIMSLEQQTVENEIYNSELIKSEKSKTQLELFFDFYKKFGNNKLTEEKKSYIREVINKVVQGGIDYETY